MHWHVSHPAASEAWSCTVRPFHRATSPRPSPPRTVPRVDCSLAAQPDHEATYSHPPHPVSGANKQQGAVDQPGHCRRPRRAQSACGAAPPAARYPAVHESARAQSTQFEARRQPEGVYRRSAASSDPLSAPRTQFRQLRQPEVGCGAVCTLGLLEVADDASA